MPRPTRARTAPAAGVERSLALSGSFRPSLLGRRVALGEGAARPRGRDWIARRKAFLDRFVEQPFVVVRLPRLDRRGIVLASFLVSLGHGVLVIDKHWITG